MAKYEVSIDICELNFIQKMFFETGIKLLIIEVEHNMLTYKYPFKIHFSYYTKKEKLILIIKTDNNVTDNEIQEIVKLFNDRYIEPLFMQAKKEKL